MAADIQNFHVSSLDSNAICLIHSFMLYTIYMHFYVASIIIIHFCVSLPGTLTGVHASCSKILFSKPCKCYKQNTAYI